MVAAMAGTDTGADPTPPGDDGDQRRHDESSERTSGSVPFGIVAVGLMVGVVLGVVGAAALRTTPEPTEWGADVADLAPAEADPAAVDDFVEAWERSRTETYRAESRWHRVTPAGGELARARVVAQRPPDRLLRAGGQVEGSVDGVRYLCDDVPDESPEMQELFDPGCRAIEVPRSEDAYSNSVAEEVDALWSYVGGEQPLYRVSRDDGCFDLRLARGMFAPPYGDRARFCFDDATGAVSLLRIERPEGTDTLELLAVTPEVTDDDFRELLAGD